MNYVVKRKLFLTLGFSVICGLLMLAAVVGAWGHASAASAQGGLWTPVFTDTFSTLSPAWTLINDATNRYGWAVEPYTRSSGTLVVLDQGFWSAGGGTVGSTQSWPSGSYGNNIEVWAIAGPFTPTDKVWDMRLRFDLQNRVAAGDSLFVGLSGDGQYFTGLMLTEVYTDWQSMSWSTKAYLGGPVWIALRFLSDAQDVAAGSLVDNLILEFNYGMKVYLPLARRDPTPTPTPTPTPLPVYVDNFDDPASGWYTGVALRYNEWCRWGWDCHAGYEEVAYMSYNSGNYRIYVPVSWQGGAGDVDTWFVWPAQAALLPSYVGTLPTHYCVEARAKIANAWADYQPWWAHWGVIFGANASMTELYTFQINANHNYGAVRYHNYQYPGNRQPLDGTEVNVEIPIIPWCTDKSGYPCDLSLIPTGGYNTVKVAVQGNWVDVYVNGVLLAGGDIPGMPRDKIGLIGGSYEVTPVDLWFDYFRYDATCPEAQ